METRLTNKQKRQGRVTNKDRWARRKLGNKAKRRMYREQVAAKKVGIPAV